ncbi:Undecaprenyl-diphosphatase [Candidatus Koribacter versatilis Ellin345]|uniref:Undecaprenyl-diphosphatase n=1 Tax=Koribacter versatilis (strain Ellin345) TaxID=204669 RepID=UPPP_KORVE|nr:undecaprenyl-diphosphate phosphatase [Candidatus Koribacter versatilis]Q1IPW7.1 RecName: Full=Undecaprenyl-diphosphatase; AltName: Full=Bacitracin resistance protein; AltName: Full=Undecaprenyl pyrophosphate phosphatase [Candidatus Koribacter versatilis Ellin345]ABF41083.1 Undecaprenyl-diphosphatase [Candidatus Koribacter versatilis Ellin345]
MNAYLLAALLGVVEGLTEFLPVSSTAHLRICEALLHIDLGDGFWKMFSIVIQLGAILCLPIYFRARISEFFATFPKGKSGNHTALTHPLTLTIIAFLCTAIPAFLFTKIIGKHLESVIIMGSALLIGGIVMWIVDVMFADKGATDDMDKMSVGQAIWIGLCQVLSAVFPGTSRSMSTIAAGQLSGMTRAAALEFSFFLSIPTMVVATCYDLLKTLRHKDEAGAALGVVHMDAHAWITLAIGFIVSFIVAYFVVAWFMKWVRTRGFVPFAVYRIVVGIAVLAWALKR